MHYGKNLVSLEDTETVKKNSQKDKNVTHASHMREQRLFLDQLNWPTLVQLHLKLQEWQIQNNTLQDNEYSAANSPDYWLEPRLKDLVCLYILSEGAKQFTRGFPPRPHVIFMYLAWSELKAATVQSDATLMFHVWCANIIKKKIVVKDLRRMIWNGRI